MAQRFIHIEPGANNTNSKCSELVNGRQVTSAAEICTISAVLESVHKWQSCLVWRTHNLGNLQVCTWLTTLVETDSLSSRLY